MAKQPDVIQPIDASFDDLVNAVVPRAKREEITKLPNKINILTPSRGKMEIASTQGTLDLAAKDIARTIIGDGRKGSGVREHEVRGTWVHLQHVRSCEHQWSRVDRPPLEPDTYNCPCCGTRRVWRRDHVRGEHSRGNKFNTYFVKDSRLETRH